MTERMARRVVMVEAGYKELKHSERRSQDGGNRIYAQGDIARKRMQISEGVERGLRG